MAMVYKDRVKQTVDAPSGAAAFDFDSNGATPTGYQSFVDALADTNTCIYAAEDTSGNWEVGVGTWAEADKTLTRTTILASSNSGSAESFSGTVTVFIAADASREQSAYEAHSAVVPGGRLTLTSGTPVTTSDVTGATTIYYCPYVHDRISLWTGDYWRTIQFAETSHALGTVTSGKPYDVFAYLNAGALALEKLAWTNNTTRATAITLQDGRYCKSGDKTRLYLGTFYTTSTSATEDSLRNRLLYNHYNRAQRMLGVETTGGAYNGADRDFNNDTSTELKIVLGLGEVLHFAYACRIAYSSNTGGVVQLSFDGGSSVGAALYFYTSSGGVSESAGGQQYAIVLSAGYHYVRGRQYTTGTATFYEFTNYAVLPI